LISKWLIAGTYSAEEADSAAIWGKSMALFQRGSEGKAEWIFFIYSPLIVCLTQVQKATLTLAKIASSGDRLLNV
jgi:hypothetical protein